MLAVIIKIIFTRKKKTKQKIIVNYHLKVTLLLEPKRPTHVKYQGGYKT